jgi:hypothetical protein
MRAIDLERLAKEAGFASRTLDRAKLTAGVNSRRIGGLGRNGSWQWSLRTPRNEEV